MQGQAANVTTTAPPPDATSTPGAGSGVAAAPLSLRCGSCDAPVIPGEKYCVRCGTGLTWKVCPECDAPAYEFASFCQSCGNSLDEPPPVIIRTSATAVAPGAERPDVFEIENPILLWLRRGFTEPGSRPYFYVVGTQLSVIALSIVLIILESIKSIDAQYGEILRALEAVLLVGFLAEYVLSITFAPDKRAYLLSFWGIVDFLAVVPSLLTGVSVNLAELRAVRLLRVLRAIRVIKLAKLVRRRPDETGRPLPRSMSDDWILYGITAFCVVVISGTVVYYVEGETTPDAFPDIPTSMWWAWLIITSAGQDAIMPVTATGRVIAILTLFAGLAQFAMLIAVVARQLQRLRQDEERVRMAAQRAAQRMMILMPRKSAPAPRRATPPAA